MKVFNGNNNFVQGQNREFPFAQNLELKEFDLENGLHCILYKDNKNPIVNLSLGYEAGSKDEIPGKRGIAHLFEHLMFQGSANVKKNEHFLNVQKAGGSCNAFTMQDLTAYYEMMPSNQLETAMWLESDRMNSLDLTEENLENQKSVVIEEKMQRYDNAPYGTALHKIFEYMLKGSFYETPVIGFYEDIKSFTLEEAVSFHKNYYSPQNSILVISGDINYDDTEKQINKYFGGIKKGGKPERREKALQEFTESIRETVYDNINLPAVYIAYRIPEAGTPEEYILDYFASILANDKSSRLYKKLVYEKKMAKSVRASKYQLKDAGLFIIKAEVTPGSSTEDVEKIIFEEIENIAVRGVTSYEFEKVRNEIEFYNAVKNLTLQKISLETLFNWILFKDTGLINSKINKYLEVKAEDITGTVKKYFSGGKNLILTYLPK